MSNASSLVLEKIDSAIREHGQPLYNDRDILSVSAQRWIAPIFGHEPTNHDPSRSITSIVSRWTNGPLARIDITSIGTPYSLMALYNSESYELLHIDKRLDAAACQNFNLIDPASLAHVASRYQILRTAMVRLGLTSTSEHDSEEASKLQLLWYSHAPNPQEHSQTGAVIDMIFALDTNKDLLRLLAHRNASKAAVDPFTDDMDNASAMIEVTHPNYPNVRFLVPVVRTVVSLLEGMIFPTYVSIPRSAEHEQERLTFEETRSYDHIGIRIAE